MFKSICFKSLKDTLKKEVKIKQESRLDLLIIIFIISIGILFIPFKKILVNKDSVTYLLEAFHIYKNPSFDNIVIWRPTFIITLAISFFMIGKPSIVGAFITVRLFYVMSLVLCYLIGKKFFNRKTGILFTILILTSYWINRFSAYIHLDIVIVSFILLSIYLLKLSFSNKKNIFFLLSGVSMGLGYFVKPIIFFPILFFPVVFKLLHPKIKMKKIFFIYFSFFLISLPWIFGVLFNNKPADTLLGTIATADKPSKLLQTIPKTSNDNIFKMLSLFYISLKKFFYYYLSKHFVFAFLFILSSIAAIISLLKRKTEKSLKIIIFILLSFFPFTLLISLIDFRPSQLLIVYFILYLVTAHLIVNTLDKAIKKILLKFKVSNKFTQIISTYSITGIIIIIILTQIFYPFGNYGKENFLNMFKSKGNKDYLVFSLWANKLQITGTINNYSKKVSHWIDNNVDPGTMLLTNAIFLERSLSFYTEEKYKFDSLKTVHIQLSESYTNAKDRTYHPYMFFTYKMKGIDNNHIRVLYYEDFQEQINSLKAKYIIISLPNCSFTKLLKNNSNFQQVKDFPALNIQIFKIKEFDKNNKNATYFENQVFNYLYELEKKNPEVYKRTKESLQKNLQLGDIDTNDFFSMITKENHEEINRKYNIL